MSQEKRQEEEEEGKKDSEKDDQISNLGESRAAKVRRPRQSGQSA